MANKKRKLLKRIAGSLTGIIMGLSGAAAIAHADDNLDKTIKTTIKYGHKKAENTSINELTETVGFTHKLDKNTHYRIDLSHTDAKGTLSGLDVSGSSNSLKAAFGKRVTDSLYLEPHFSFTDDIDILDEFGDEDVSSVGLGLGGEYVVKKPFSFIWDATVSPHSEGGTDWSAMAGGMYYYGDDWFSLRGVHWEESLPGTETNMGYAMNHKKWGKIVDTTAWAGMGKEQGEYQDRKVTDIGLKIGKDISDEVRFEVTGNRYKSAAVNNNISVGVTWRF